MEEPQEVIEVKQSPTKMEVDLAEVSHSPDSGSKKEKSIILCPKCNSVKT
jgi:hypothetical protein